MGANQSTRITQMEASKAVAEATTSPPGVLPPMPKLRRPETFEEKLYRKFTSEPLIPIGCLTTAYFLGSGIKSFYNRDAAQSQKMMRLRVGAQFATLMIFIGYYGFSQFNLGIAPGMAAPPTPGDATKQKKED
mmetsp:Transcript_7810/g.10682  ORF Transcript_7810/g.10682 Transcript_7810/m.10682 type:complete len:133 (-) Transcript_7810:357-755(-)|eukprot:CAMPEP_0185732570 /NCGR_PEP_ID=MMETSP1171-20130828/16679_1 /TAXON_ID=374046 /ORGANISM="Helicotheca tamensis, Strain CCMP826" /LENGTH=132 /DNA_ID=CAMNT_0028402093 /DNA_START=96 /DNA_END=494 /DNA_ORIENTATION=-